jgi:predicted transposase/invertase (TIGR01784 family)
MDELIYQSHDNFFRGTFSIPEVAREHISAFFPTNVLEKMDLANMVLDPTAYVSESLSGHYSDLVWQIPYGKNKKSQIKVALLFEHKTKGSNEVYFQLLRYIVEVWEKRKVDKKERLLVIPFVVFQSKNKWVLKPFWTLFKSLKQHPELKPFFPNFEFLRLDVNEENQAVLAQKQAMEGLAVMKTMYQVTHKRFKDDEIYTFFDDLAKLIPNAAPELFLLKIIFVYFLGNAKGDTADIIYNLKLKSQHPPNFMSALDVLIERGERAAREEGISIGEAKGKAEGKAEGKEEGIELTKKVFQLHLKGVAIPDIAAQLSIDIAIVEDLLAI